jgi:hypothetical protein
MATGKEALVGAAQNININSNAKASPSNQSIGSSDSVIFNNNDPNDAATVTFLAHGINEFSYQGTPISSFTIPAGGSYGPLTPTAQNVTVDYNVSVGQNSGGPFSVEVGSGALQIDIVNVFGNTDLPVAGIPNNGTLFFNNETSGTATITFGKADVLFDSNGNSVTSQTVNANSGGALLTARGTNQDVSYSVEVADHPRRVEGGNGTIKVGSN